MICTYTTHSKKCAAFVFFCVCWSLSLSRLTRCRGAVSIISWRQWVTRSDADDAAAAGVGGEAGRQSRRRRAVG